MSETPTSPTPETADQAENIEIDSVSTDVNVDGDVDDIGDGEIIENEPESTLDLAAIERDLDGVERALNRLDDGTYWTDEVTGAPLPDDLLAANPVARHL